MSDADRQGRMTTASEMLGRRRGSTTDKGTLGGALSALGGQLGNDELMARLSAGNTSRDDLLDFLVQRLEQMRTAQLAELDLTKLTDDSSRTTFGESGNQNEQPKPKRWQEAAKLYQDAAKALCSGQLQRGTALVEQAVTADKKAFEEMSKFVKIEVETALDAPVGSGDVGPNTACTTCEEPEGVGIADEILRVTTEGMSVKGQRRELDPWWTDLEEEEEEEESSGS